MKTIMLSFDDSRKDTYSNAFPIMIKNNLRATVNVISDFVFNPKTEICFPSAGEAMSLNDLKEWKKCGFEIACHGRLHTNESADVIDCINDLKEHGLCNDSIGFASPQSDLTSENMGSYGIDELLRKGTIAYARSGTQVKREGLLFCIFSILEKVTHSKKLFYFLNKKNIVDKKLPVIPSVAIKKYTSIKQLNYFIDQMPDGSSVVFMFHSILKASDKGYLADDYYWDFEAFNLFCELLSSKRGLRCETLIDFIKQDHNNA